MNARTSSLISGILRQTELAQLSDFGLISLYENSPAFQRWDFRDKERHPLTSFCRP